MDRAKEAYLRTLATEKLEKMLILNAGLLRDRRMDDDLFRYMCTILADRAEQEEK